MDIEDLALAMTLALTLDRLPETTPVMVEGPDGQRWEIKHARSVADGSAIILSANEPDPVALDAEVEAEVQRQIDAGYMQHIMEMRARRN